MSAMPPGVPKTIRYYE